MIECRVGTGGTHGQQWAGGLVGDLDSSHLEISGRALGPRLWLQGLRLCHKAPGAEPAYVGVDEWMAVLVASLMRWRDIVVMHF